MTSESLKFFQQKQVLNIHSFTKDIHKMSDIASKMVAEYRIKYNQIMKRFADKAKELAKIKKQLRISRESFEKMSQMTGFYQNSNKQLSQQNEALKEKVKQLMEKVQNLDDSLYILQNQKAFGICSCGAKLESMAPSEDGVSESEEAKEIHNIGSQDSERSDDGEEDQYEMISQEDNPSALQSDREFDPEQDQDCNV